MREYLCVQAQQQRGQDAWRGDRKWESHSRGGQKGNWGSTMYSPSRLFIRTLTFEQMSDVVCFRMITSDVLRIEFVEKR